MRYMEKVISHVDHVFGDDQTNCIRGYRITKFTLPYFHLLILMYHIRDGVGVPFGCAAGICI